MPELLARHGLDDDSLIDKHLLPLMNAEETKFFTLPVGKGKDRRLQIESRKTANWSARQNGLDMALKIRGLYVREQENKGPEFSVVMIDRSYRPDWAAMRRTQPKLKCQVYRVMENLKMISENHKRLSPAAGRAALTRLLIV